jgi:hypothetical protein
MINMSSINPYELLGVDPQKATLKQLKRRYYDLALLVHPDKNAVADGSQMHVVHSAYEYCKREMQHTAARATTYESLEADFAEFSAQQTMEPPSFRDIAEDALEMDRFNREFEALADEGVMRAAAVDGYGQHMASAPGQAGDETIEGIEYGRAVEDAMTGPVRGFDGLVAHRDALRASQCAFGAQFYEFGPLGVPLAKRSSFTDCAGPVSMADYREAHTYDPEPAQAFADFPPCAGEVDMHAFLAKRDAQDASYRYSTESMFDGADRLCIKG